MSKPIAPYPVFDMSKPIAPYPVYEKNISCPAFTDVSDSEKQKCLEAEGQITYDRDPNDCATKFKCDMCGALHTAASKKFFLMLFIISAILGLAAIFIGLYLPNANSINDWIGAGFIIGGLITIFVGTIRAYPYINDTLKPLILLGEIILVIYLAVKKLWSEPLNMHT